MSTNQRENPHAGKGSSVLLDIGGDVGALVVEMPAVLEGQEIELRGMHHDVGHGHGHGRGLPHVAVVPRPAPDGQIIHSAVFFEIPQGSYELYVRPSGQVQLTVEVTGGAVTHAKWPVLSGPEG
ncbi:hypothetical protein [Kribbella soli]|uniref:Uncharacterized protein n=1 Tax=Kribbella soli TaxID=1124743 RepID=A0A4R0HDJ1_9ACTN|nr:hypothetical protein [Kribbella soli]TCC08363.1 hypothetical protein E0H45_20980 [Kribbella soli]